MSNYIENLVYDNLPHELNLLVENFEGREKDIVLLSSLVVLSACLPNVTGAYDKHRVFPNLYLVIIAPAASGKGVAMNALHLIDKIHQSKIDSSKSLFEQWKRELSKAEANNEEYLLPMPEMEFKVLPANTSTAEFYAHMKNNEEGLLMFESEIDTLGNSLKVGWSDFSDLLRKIWHHEKVSITRKKDKLFVEINNPKLSIVLTGTQEQLNSVISSRENGLFSRFMVYSYEEFIKFKNVFNEETDISDVVFKTVGDEIHSLYEKLRKLGANQIIFSFSPEQKNEFLEHFSHVTNRIRESYPQGFIANVKRHGLIMFRIAMILTVIRRKEEVQQGGEIVCENEDFQTSLKLADNLLRHSLQMYNSFETEYLSIIDGEILDLLKDNFTRKDMIEVGTGFNLSERTLDNKLNKWCAKKLIKHLKHGHYKKT